MLKKNQPKFKNAVSQKNSKKSLISKTDHVEDRISQLEKKVEEIDHEAKTNNSSKIIYTEIKRHLEHHEKTKSMNIGYSGSGFKPKKYKMF